MHDCTYLATVHADDTDAIKAEVASLAPDKLDLALAEAETEASLLRQAYMAAYLRAVPASSLFERITTGEHAFKRAVGCAVHRVDILQDAVAARDAQQNQDVRRAAVEGRKIDFEALPPNPEDVLDAMLATADGKRRVFALLWNVVAPVGEFAVETTNNGERIAYGEAVYADEGRQGGWSGFGNQDFLRYAGTEEERKRTLQRIRKAIDAVIRRVAAIPPEHRAPDGRIVLAAAPQGQPASCGWGGIIDAPIRLEWPSVVARLAVNECDDMICSTEADAKPRPRPRPGISCTEGGMEPEKDACEWTEGRALLRNIAAVMEAAPRPCGDGEAEDTMLGEMIEDEAHAFARFRRLRDAAETAIRDAEEALREAGDASGKLMLIWFKFRLLGVRMQKPGDGSKEQQD